MACFAAVSAKVLFAGRPTFNSCFIALTHAYYVTPLFLWIKTFLAIRMPNMKSAFYKGYKSFRTSYAIFLNVIYDSMALLNLPRELYLYNCIYLIFFFEHSLRMLNNTLFQLHVYTFFAKKACTKANTIVRFVSDKIWWLNTLCIIPK